MHQDEFINDKMQALFQSEVLIESIDDIQLRKQETHETFGPYVHKPNENSESSILDIFAEKTTNKVPKLKLKHLEIKNKPLQIQSALGTTSSKRNMVDTLRTPITPSNPSNQWWDRLSTPSYIKKKSIL